MNILKCFAISLVMLFTACSGGSSHNDSSGGGGGATVGAFKGCSLCLDSDWQNKMT